MTSLRERARLLALRSYAGALGRSRGGPSTGRRVLAIRPDHLGDLLLSVPALRRIREELPRCRLGLLVGPWNVEAAAGIPYADEVLTLPFPFFDRRPRGDLARPYRVLHREGRRLRAGDWDTALILRHDFWWGALLAQLAGIPRRIGYAVPEVLPFLTDAVPYAPAHETEQALQLAAALGGGTVADARSIPLEFQPGEAALRAGRAWLQQKGLGPRFAVLHPGAGAPVKQWSAERFARVADGIHLSAGMDVVVTGSQSEAPLVNAVVEGSSAKAAGLTGAPLGMVAGVLSDAAMALGVDSGIMHLAEAVGTPTVRLFGPIDTRRFGPWGDPSLHRVVRSSPACIPCNRLDHAPSELSLHPCIRAITVDQVLSEATALMGLLERGTCASA